jgi:hypothetical protein
MPFSPGGNRKKATAINGVARPGGFFGKSANQYNVAGLLRYQERLQLAIRLITSKRRSTASDSFELPATAQRLGAFFRHPQP